MNITNGTQYLHAFLTTKDLYILTPALKLLTELFGRDKVSAFFEKKREMLDSLEPKSSTAITK